jgi:hypothetical protein
MKTFKLITCFLAVTLLLSNCCVKPPQSNNNSLKYVHVQSGKITSDVTFTSSNGFNPDDNALGIIDSTCSVKKNGFLAPDETVYVFKIDTIPQNIKNLKNNLIYNLLIAANWLPDYTYNLNFDAMLCKTNFIFFTREKGHIKRYKANVLGNVVYKFTDNVYKEDYSTYLEYHNNLKRENDETNLYTILGGLSPSNYTLSTSRASLIINSASGGINLASSLETPIGTFDKIYITPNGPGQKYLFRFLYYKHAQTIINDYFQGNYVKKERLESWKTYLNESIYPKFSPIFVEGYSCPCNENKRMAPGGGAYMPPLPLNANGTQ